MWRNCQALSKLVLSSYIGELGYSGSINTARSMFLRCYDLKRLILPKVSNYYKLSDGSGPSSFTLIDFGMISNIGSDNAQATRYGITTSTAIIIRSTSVPTVGTNLRNTMRKVYVPTDLVDAYKADATWSAASAYIFAIGGEEWVEQFGGSNEYANLTEQEYQDNYA